MIEEKYRDQAVNIETSIEAIKRTGIKVLALADRYAKLTIPLQGNINHVGMMYAGTLFTLGEIPGGAVFLTSFDTTKYYPIVKEVSIRFRRPALTDVTVEVSLTPQRVEEMTAELEAKGKVDYGLDLELKDMSGEVVALVSGTWQIRKVPGA
jgi:acyl-coenzyme A thioesterase PaaI-like protein